MRAILGIQQGGRPQAESERVQDRRGLPVSGQHRQRSPAEFQREAAQLTLMRNPGGFDRADVQLLPAGFAQAMTQQDGAARLARIRRVNRYAQIQPALEPGRGLNQATAGFGQQIGGYGVKLE